MKAVYEQNTKNHELEFKLVQLTTVREGYLQDFRELERAVIEKRRKFNDDSILDGMRLLNNIRDISFDLVEQIGEWQKMYVKAKRPTIMNCDYLTEMITSTEFVNSSPIRKHFNFAIMRRNLFLLPLATGKPKDTVETTKELIAELERFANPDVDRLISCYSLFQKSFPAKVFKTIMSMDRWVFSLYQPNVEVYRTLPPVGSLPQQGPQTTVTTKRKQSTPTVTPPQTAAAPLNPCPEITVAVTIAAESSIAKSTVITTQKSEPTSGKSSLKTTKKGMQQSSVSSVRPPLGPSAATSAASIGEKGSLTNKSSTSLPPVVTSSSFSESLPPPKTALKSPTKKLLTIDTAVTAGIADGKLVTSPHSSVGEFSQQSSALLQSAVPSPKSAVSVLGGPVAMSSSNVFSEASISTFGGAGGGVDGPPVGVMSTAQLRDWYKAHAHAKKNDDSDDDDDYY
jgi:hypothetical protein